MIYKISRILQDEGFFCQHAKQEFHVLQGTCSFKRQVQELPACRRVLREPTDADLKVDNWGDRLPSLGAFVQLFLLPESRGPPSRGFKV